MSSESPSPASTAGHSSRVPWTTWLAIAAGLAVILPVEYIRWKDSLRLPGGWVGWLTTAHVDTTRYLYVFLLLPVLWFLQMRRPWARQIFPGFFQTWFGPQTKPHAGTTRRDALRALLLAGLVAGLSWSVSSHFGRTQVTVLTPYTRYEAPLSELPPALHDEYSYLFQAKTFLMGRLANPSPADCPELFDQIHVLNDNRIYAGRYFPGTAAWMMPFVAAGKPHWGHWLAGALSAAFVFYIGRELAGNALGLAAGLFAALSPGIVTFGQLLLAHHPTLMGLTFFAWMFLRMMRTRCFLTAALVGAGLIFATLCRPMTAAGIGLPFGVWFAWWWLRGPKRTDEETPWDFQRRSLLVASMALPIALGIGGMMVYNARLTGNALFTPYQLYTDIYTPRHVYGFNNVERAKANPSDKVVEKYDRWAENLTPALAARNMRDRLIATGQWVWGLVPLTMAVAVFPFAAGRDNSGPALSDRRWWLIFLAAVSLHVTHIPYWFAGIRNWHYVFEAAPFLLLVLAGVMCHFLWRFWQSGHAGLCLWWIAMILLAFGAAYGDPWSGSEDSRIRLALREDIWARRNYAVFNDMLDRVITDRPALVLVAEDPTDRHIDYVTNDPVLDGPVLRGRFRPEINPPEEVLKCFPDRAVYVVVLNETHLSQIERGVYSEVRFQDLGRHGLTSHIAAVYRVSHPANEVGDDDRSE